jgi:ABC-2 type transport system ATP-binding protein
MRFGENVFEVMYGGEVTAFESAMSPLADMLSTTEVADTPYHCTRLKLKSPSVRESIAVANEAVELRSFREVIPSMNDIFIRAVEGTL